MNIYIYILHLMNIFFRCYTYDLVWLKEGCTRFEVEHISFNLVIVYRKNIEKIGEFFLKISQHSKYPKNSCLYSHLSQCNVRTSEFRLLILGYFGVVNLSKNKFPIFTMFFLYTIVP